MIRKDLPPALREKRMLERPLSQPDECSISADCGHRHAISRLQVTSAIPGNHSNLGHGPSIEDQVEKPCKHEVHDHPQQAYFRTKEACLLNAQRSAILTDPEKWVVKAISQRMRHARYKNRAADQSQHAPDKAEQRRVDQVYRDFGGRHVEPGIERNCRISSPDFP
jgi:hypothetical protein